MRRRMCRLMICEVSRRCIVCDHRANIKVGRFPPPPFPPMGMAPPGFPPGVVVQAPPKMNPPAAPPAPAPVPIIPKIVEQTATVYVGKIPPTVEDEFIRKLLEVYF